MTKKVDQSHCDLVVSGNANCMATTKEWLDAYIEALSARNDHNGVIVAGCNPWRITVMPKPEPIQKLYSCEEFVLGKFYTDPTKPEPGHVFIKAYSGGVGTFVSVNTGMAGYHISPGKRYVEVRPSWEVVK